MPQSLQNIAYLVAGVLFISSLGGLSKQQSAGRGNVFGIVGMIIALVATAAHPSVTGYAVLAGAIGVGAVIGALLAARVAMTNMPQLVAILHSFVGAAAVLVGIASFLAPPSDLSGAEAVIHEIEVFIGVFIGAITFTGSIVAYGKLQGLIRSKPLLLPGRHLAQPHHGRGLPLARSAVPFGAGARRPAAAADHDGDRRSARRAPGDGHRRRRHARGRVDAQQLLRLGGCRGGLHARQRSLDHHWRAGRIERRHSQLHHVQGDEPIHRQRDLRRLWRRRRRSPGQDLRRTPGRGGQRHRDRHGSAARQRQERGGRAGLRHGRCPSAVPAVGGGGPACASAA